MIAMGRWLMELILVNVSICRSVVEVEWGKLVASCSIAACLHVVQVANLESHVIVVGWVVRTEIRSAHGMAVE